MISRYFDHLVYFFVCLSVIFYVPIREGTGNPVEYGYQVQELFFRYGVFFVFLVSLFLKPLRQADLRVLSAFLIYEMLLCALFGFNIVSRRVLLNLVSGALFYKVVSEYMTVRLKTFGFWALGLLAINSLLMVFQVFNLDHLFTHAGKIELGLKTIAFDEKVIGFMKLKANVGTLGALLGMVLAFIHPIISILAVPFMILGQTSAGIAAFVISFLFALFFRLKRRIWMILVILILLGSGFYVLKYDLPAGQFQERFKVWHEATFIILKTNPIIGAGPDSFSLNHILTPQGEGFESIEWKWAHNEYLQTLFEYGLAGLFFLGLFLRNQIIDFVKFRQDRDIQLLFSTCLSIALISMFSFPLHVGKFAGLCVLILALYHAKVSELRCL